MGRFVVVGDATVDQMYFVKDFPGPGGEVNALRAVMEPGGAGGTIAAVVAMPFAAPLTVSGGDLAVLIVIGAGVMPVSFGLIFLGPKYLPASEVALMMLLEMILGPLLVWLVLAEAPPVRVILAGAMIAATVAAHALSTLRRSGRP